MFAVSVEKVLASGSANEDVGTSAATVSKPVREKLWACQSLNTVVTVSQFDSVVRSLDNLNATLFKNTAFQQTLVNHALGQLSTVAWVHDAIKRFGIETPG